MATTRFFVGIRRMIMKELLFLKHQKVKVSERSNVKRSFVGAKI